VPTHQDRLQTSFDLSKLGLNIGMMMLPLEQWELVRRLATSGASKRASLVQLIGWLSGQC
jgi:hypothetical protein